MEMVSVYFEKFAVAVIICIAVLIMACIVRSILGPRVTDRVVAVNSIGTMTIVIIAVLAVLLDEAYLLDVCLIYAMISFVAVIVLTKILTGVYREEHHWEEALEPSQILSQAVEEGETVEEKDLQLYEGMEQPMDAAKSKRGKERN